MPNVLTFAKSSRAAKTLLLVLAASLFAVFLTVAGGASAARADSTASISGVVQGAGTPNVALASATVALYQVTQPSPFPQYVATTTTDANGAYSFTDLAPGNYTADFQAADGSVYVEQWWNDKTQIFDADTFVVADGQAVTGIDPVLAAGGAITGTIEGQGSPDAPLPGAIVDATGSDGSFHSGVADENGTYSISGLAAGSYTVQFNPPFFGNTNYVAEWWNNQPTQQTANAVTVGAGQTVSGIGAVLQAGSTISGTVSAAGAGALSGVVVNAILSDGSLSQTATTDANGNYAIQSLAPGSYTLVFAARGTQYTEQWWSNESSLATADYFTVGAGDAVTGKDAVLAVGGSISGTVTAGSPAAPLANATVTVFGKSDPGLDGGFATTDADGNYTVVGLSPGSYVVQFSPPIGQSYASGWWQDSSSFESATPVTIDSSGAVTGIDGTLSPGASISGRVLAPGTSDIGLAGATVEAFGSDHEPDGYAVTDADGRYTVSDLPAGAYSIQFVPQSDQNIAREWWGGSFILTGAKTVTVTAGESVTDIDQRLIGGATVTGSVTLQGVPSNGTRFDVVFFASDQPIGEGNQPPIQALTDESGNYSQPALAPGTYTVEFFNEGDGWLTQWWKNKSSQATATRLTIKAGQTKTNVSAVLAPANVTAKTPRITGKIRVGSSLTAVAGNWKPSGVSLSYQWARNGQDIGGATSSTYSLTNQDVGAAIAVRVTGTQERYNPATATSAPTKVVTGGILTPAVPQISGSLVRGQTLTATPGTWGPGTVALSYRWSRNGSRIGGATSATYVLAKADIGKAITVTVTGSETNYTSLASTSAATGVIH